MSLPDVFISYKRNHEASEHVVLDIEQTYSGTCNFLRDQHIDAGKRWSKELYSWLLKCRAAIVIVSKEAKQSDWCRREWSVLAARSEVVGLKVIPIHIELEIIETGILDEMQAWKRDEDTISKIGSLLDDIPAGELSSLDFLAAHQAWLRWQFEEELVLGREPYSLADVYIESECGKLSWGESNPENKDEFKDPFQEKNGGRNKLLTSVLNSFADPKFRDLVVIQGGPGSGKSAFTLRLARELMKNHFNPILVRFRDLRLSTFPNIGALIDDAIRIGKADEDSPHFPGAIVTSKLLDTSHKVTEEQLNTGPEWACSSMCNTVFILDGWDEVSLTGNVRYQEQLGKWLPKLREYFTGHRGPPVHLVLTGRPSDEVQQSGVLLADTPICTIRPIRPENLRDFASKISEKLDVAVEQNLVADWTLDFPKFTPVFDHYQTWFEKFQTNIMDDTQRTPEVLGSPLLAFLAFRVIAQSKQNPASLISNATALYHELIEITVAHAGKGIAAELKGTVHRGGEKLRYLLQEVASVISILRGESVSFNELSHRFGDKDLPVNCNRLTDWEKAGDSESTLKELVVNFYFKGGNTELGCEFLHKSFREYLFAEAIFTALLNISEEKSEALPDPNLKYWEEFKEATPQFHLSRSLSYLLAPQWLTQEVRGHVFWLIERAINKEPERWVWIRDLLLDVYVWWAEGVHLRHQPIVKRGLRDWVPPFINTIFLQSSPFDPDGKADAGRTCIFDAHLGHALMQITAMVHSLVHENEASIGPWRENYQYIEAPSQVKRFRPGGSGFIKALIARMDSEGWRQTSGLEGMVLPKICLNQANLEGTNLQGADLRGAALQGADLRGAALRGADLRGAALQGANLRGAALQEADLQLAALQGANLRETNLPGADLRKADLQRANLRKAILQRADLRKADLRGADLRGAALQGAALQGANLQGADLERAALRGAEMKGSPLL